MRIILRILTLTIILYGCVSNEHEYYESGEIKSEKSNRLFAKNYELITFTIEGDTLEKSSYNRKDKLDGKSVIFSYDSLSVSKRIYTYLDGVLNGEAQELVNGNIKFKWEYRDNLRQGAFIAYFQDKSIKWNGYFFNDEICYMNVYTEDGVLKETHNYFNYGATSRSNVKDRMFFWIDFGKVNPILLGQDILYATFMIKARDTLKLTDQVYLSSRITDSRLEVPLECAEPGEYYIKLAIPAVNIYEDNHVLYNLNYNVDQDFMVNFEGYEAKDRLKLKW